MDLGTNFYDVLRKFHQKRVKIPNFSEEDVLSTWKLLKKSTGFLKKKDQRGKPLFFSSNLSKNQNQNQSQSTYIPKFLATEQGSLFRPGDTVQSMNCGSDDFPKDPFLDYDPLSEHSMKQFLTTEIHFKDVKFTINLHHRPCMDQLKLAQDSHLQSLTAERQRADSKKSLRQQKVKKNLSKQ